jgi:hypothetical protein
MSTRVFFRLPASLSVEQAMAYVAAHEVAEAPRLHSQDSVAVCGSVELSAERYQEIATEAARVQRRAEGVRDVAEAWR